MAGRPRHLIGPNLLIELCLQTPRAMAWAATVEDAHCVLSHLAIAIVRSVINAQAKDEVSRDVWHQSLDAVVARMVVAGAETVDLNASILEKYPLYRLHAGPRIFPAVHCRGLRKLVGRPLYSPEPLRAAIAALIPDAPRRKLAAHPRPLVLTALNWTTSRLHLLCSGATPQADALGLSLMDAMLATSAAPAHFPPHRVEHHVFVDGGLVANAPDLLAWQMAQTLCPGADIHMLSIGTANPLFGRDPSSLPERGLAWARPVIELVMNAQEMHAVEECARWLGPHRYLRLNMAPSAAQVKKMDFDVANAASTQLLMGLADQCTRDLPAHARMTLANLLR